MSHSLLIGGDVLALFSNLIRAASKKGTVGTWDNRVIIKNSVAYMVNSHGVGIALIQRKASDTLSLSGVDAVLPGEAIVDRRGRGSSLTVLFKSEKETGSGFAEITNKGVKIRARLMDYTQAPAFPDLPDASEWRKIGPFWNDAVVVSEVANATTTHETHPELACVRLLDGVSVATDGVRACLSPNDLPEDYEGVIPSRLLEVCGSSFVPSHISLGPTKAFCMKRTSDYWMVVFAVTCTIKYPDSLIPLLQETVDEAAESEIVFGVQDEELQHALKDTMKSFCGTRGLKISGEKGESDVLFQVEGNRGSAEYKLSLTPKRWKTSWECFVSFEMFASLASLSKTVAITSNSNKLVFDSGSGQKYVLVAYQLVK